MSKNNDIVTKLLICDSANIKLPENAQKILSPTEHKRLAGIRHPGQARLFLLGRYLLRRWLAVHLAEDPGRIPIRIDSRGKPRLDRPGWHFNISHSGTLLALAIGNAGPLGVDLEGRRLDPARILRLAHRYLSDTEQRWLAHSREPELDFIRLWTVKEAVLKAQGGGIANNLQRVQWQAGSHRALFDDQPYRLYQYTLDRAWLTLAVAGTDGPPPLLLRLPDLPFDLEIGGPQPNLTINP
jgi:4'-phosphopantetheinyl transferase